MVPSLIVLYGLVLPYIFTPVYVSKYMGRQVWREAPGVMRAARCFYRLVRSTRLNVLNAMYVSLIV